MEKYKENKTLVRSKCDYDFNFDFDLRFNGFDYLLGVFYALFVLPFVVLFNLMTQFLQQLKGRTKVHTEELERVKPFPTELCVGPCCLWPDNFSVKINS